jgi:outer membrane protein
MLVRHVVTACVLAAALAVVSPAAALGAEVRIAYVDMQSAMDQSKAGQEAITLLNGKGKEYKTAEEKMKKELDGLTEELRTRAAVMAPAEKNRREEALTEKRRDFEWLQNDNRKKFSRDQERYTEKIRQDLLEIIKKIGKDRGYTLVLEKNFSAVLYAPKDIDLTEEITREYDKGYVPRSLD